MVVSLNKDQIKTQEFGVNPGSERVGRRLPAVTRQLATRALAGEHGRSLQKADFTISDDFFMGMPTPNAIAAEAIRLIGQKAPLRILPGERLAGAATLSEAADHQIPVALAVALAWRPARTARTGWKRASTRWTVRGVSGAALAWTPVAVGHWNSSGVSGRPKRCWRWLCATRHSTGLRVAA